ncbi:hypothetical protein BDV93DRAFT_606705 [Ceratobasidium sp. AG-I]|nr:hypothetical protein BDV93DRAFT_606705 [Ceratobasidium sp. AG-I]
MSHPLPAKPTTVRTPPIPTLVPAALNPSAALLLSALALPAGAAVVCRAWSGPDDAIDTARRHIADVAAGAPDVVSALASVVRPDVELSLWVFAVVAIDATAPRLDALDFTTLGLKEMTPSIARFELAYLYPCSAACARVSVPCAECTKPRTPTVCPLARTAPRLARPVRRPLRALYVLWTCAVRALAIERLSHPSLLAAGNGVLVCPPDEPTGEWGRPWSDPTRTLIHAHVHVSLAHPLPRPSAPTHLLIHLVPQTTTLLPVLSTPSVPGTPVLLLPLCTPAYAVAPYTGPTPHGFLQSLAGRGIPPSAAASTCILVWLPLPSSLYATATSPANMNALPTPSATTPAAGSGAGARGMYAIWPRALCVADTAASAIDISRLPGAPVGLTGTTLAMPHSKPRRFPLKTPKLSRPIALAQPSNQAPLGTALTSAQPLASAGAQPPSVDTDPAMSALANTAASLIDAVVRAREREKEKQRARMERARSGSAVPIPSLSGVGLGAGTGPSTPVESLSATSSTATVPPSLQIQTQTQTQTPSAMSAMYMSPPDVTPIQQHTPVHHFSSASTNPGAATSSVPDFISPAGSDTTLGIGMDLFGDQDTAFSEGYVSEDAAFGIEADVGGAFGADAFGTSGAFPYDSTGGSSIPYHSGGSNSAVGASTYPTRPYEPELYEDLWNAGVVKVEDQKVAGTGIGVIQAEDDDMATFGEDDFDFLDSWGPSASGSVEGGLDAAIGMDVTIDTMPNLDGMDLDLGAGVGPTSPPMSSSTCTPTPTIQTPKSRTEPKPYFPLTPPAEKSHDPGGGKKGWLEPLQFTQKFEGVDGKYRGLDGKFVFRLGGATLPGTGGKGMAAAAGTSIAGATRGGSGAAGTVARTAQPSTEFPSRSWSLGSLVGQGVYGSTLAYSAARLQSQAQTQPRSRAQSQSQSQYQVSTQFSSKPQLQLFTPHPSPGTLRRLRAGYIGLTNPSAKRIRTLKLTHTKPEV